MSERDHYWMQQALEQAQLAAAQGEVPVGAVLVQNDQCIAKGFNRPIGLCDPSAHAEIVVMREAAKKLKNYRLLDTTLYVTLEPCAMCAGAMIQARIKRVVFAALDPRAGAVQSVFQVLDEPQLNHNVAWAGDGPDADAAGALLKGFFAARRRA
ncbi:MAG: tRNA adenosine(34) deaminase TadA [Gammaproteobacteria bacterium]|nr:tRNA adenosine(34) deaminase TadA [Gammaproteobacteria bacterium]MCH9743840.1 tRNA adenosine(34) deaminase TadA [Gammaproteobacteria bacterium]